MASTADKLPSIRFHLDGEVAASVAELRRNWRTDGRIERIWQHDASVWTGVDEDRWLGWLDAPSNVSARVDEFRSIAARLRADGMRQIVLLGMGGSSLCPEVLRETLGVGPDGIELFVLDSIAPAQVLRVARRIDWARVGFIVASKSGSTIEPNVLRQFFEGQLRERERLGVPGSRFIAVTDPGTKMDALARELQFCAVVHGDPTIGGRFSALSPFGIVPAALLDVDTGAFLARAAAMAEACAKAADLERHPACSLGLVLGALNRVGRDKLTFTASPGLRSLGSWLEQLIAESTGKLGKGIIPVDLEDLAPAESYGDDRIFVFIELAHEPFDSATLASLSAAGHPIVQITLSDPLDIAAEFFRWEFATAVAGSVLGINPFDQPDVEAAKIKARELAARYTTDRAMPDETPFADFGGLALLTDFANEHAIRSKASEEGLGGLIAAHLARIASGDYFAINAYLDRNADHELVLQRIRHMVRDRKGVATTVGFGPRFLHSTGQLHKGGPNSGVFLQITSDDAEDASIPGEAFTLGQLLRFQAIGDFQVLTERNRRALRVHLSTTTVAEGLARLESLVAAALP